MTATISKAQESDAHIISDLAERIWFSVYADILPQAQITLMLQNIYAVPALRSAMGEGQDFFLLKEYSQVIGFVSLRKKDANTLRIEKLYLQPDQHGKGYGKLLLDFASMQAQERSCTKLELNVNRKNPAVAFYKKCDFIISKAVDIPYHGFILDDYVMEKTLSIDQ